MVLHTCLLPGIGAEFFGFAEVQGDCVEITEWLGHGLIFFFTKIPLIGDAMAAFLAVVLVGTAFAISTRYKRDFPEPLATAIEARVRLLDDVTGGSTAEIDSARLAFARGFNEVDEDRKSTRLNSSH